MPDITMCNNKECTLKEKCYRYKAIPSMVQSYTNFKQDKKGKCNFFIKVK